MDDGRALGVRMTGPGLGGCPYSAMDNPPPDYPQLTTAWTVCCVNKVSLLLALELTTPFLGDFALFVRLRNNIVIWACMSVFNMRFTQKDQ